MQKYILLIFIILLCFLSACNKVVDADNLLDTSEKLLITSYISPQDTVLRVNVTRLLSSTGTSLNFDDPEGNEAKFLVKNAEVSISNEAGNTTNLTYSEENKGYQINATTLTISSNQAYFLKVLLDGKEFNASCTIPEKVTEINQQINFQDDEFDGIEADVNLAFKDLIGGRNYYVIGATTTVTVKYDDGETQTSVLSLDFYSDRFLTDNLEDGSSLSGRSYAYIGENVEVVEGNVTLQVAHVEEAMFQYLKSELNNSSSNGNPFTEYSIAPSSFSEEDVLGVFAGYQLTEKIIDIELD